MEEPKISVIIPLYNHEQYIGECIESVFAQTFSDFELIVIDDGSQDASGGIVKSIKDKRIKYSIRKIAEHTIRLIEEYILPKANTLAY